MSKKFKTLSYMLLATLILTIFLSSCKNNGSPKTGYNVNTIRMAQSRVTSAAAAIWLVMKDQGYFESHLPNDVMVKWEEAGLDNDRRDAVISGHSHFTTISSPSYFHAKAGNLPIRLLSKQSYLDNKLYTNNDNINSLDDLKPTDKIILAGPLGSSLHLQFQIMCLEEYGDAYKFDSQLIPMTVSDTLALMQSSNEAQAALILNSPGMDTGLRMILDLEKYGDDFDLEFFCITESQFAEDNPLIVEAYYAAEKETIEFMTKHPDKAAEILVKYWEGETIQGVENMLRNTPPRTEFSESGYNKLGAFMYEIGILEDEPVKFAELPNYDTIPKID